MKWVFADEQTISSGTTGKFKLRVSGCSRPELNGDYVQQKEFYYRRPIFHCLENERYLFYHGKRHPAAASISHFNATKREKRSDSWKRLFPWGDMC